MASRISTIFFTFSKGSIFFSIAKILIKTRPLHPSHLSHPSHSSQPSHPSQSSQPSQLVPARPSPPTRLTRPTCLTSLPVRLALPLVSHLCLCGSHSHLSHISACAARTPTCLTSLPVRLALPPVPAFPALPPLILTLFIKYLSIISSV